MFKRLLLSALLLTSLCASAQQVADPTVLMVVASASGKQIRGNLNLTALTTGNLSLIGRNGEVLKLDKTMQTANTWVGTVRGYPKSSATFTTRKNIVTGMVIYGNTVLELQPDRNTPSGHVINVSSQSDITKKDKATGTLPTLTGADLVQTGTQYQHDILVYYTAGAMAVYGSNAAIESAIANQVAISNQVYVNSGINVLLRLAYVGPTTYVSTGDAPTDVNNLRGTTDGYMDEVHALRNQVGADILVLIVAPPWNYCGYSTNSSDGLYANAVSTSCFGNYSFTHEIGHSQGAGHNREDAAYTGSTANINYGYGYRYCNRTDGLGFRTVMSYSCTGAPVVGIFSSPSLTYNGLPTGVDYATSPSTAADNVRNINERAALVASARTLPGIVSPPSAPANLTATSSRSDQVVLKWGDLSNNEDGFTIQRSLDGVTFSTAATVGANSTSFTDTGRLALTKYYYRVRSYNSGYSSAYSNTASITTPAVKVKGKPTR